MRLEVALQSAGVVCVGISIRSQLLKKSTWLLQLINDMAPPGARDSSEVSRGGLIWYLSSSPFLSVGFSIRDETMDVGRSAHYHVGFIYALP